MMNRLFFLVFLLLTSCTADLTLISSEILSPEHQLTAPYESSQSCQGCHSEIYMQYENSMHSKAFDNPVFSAHYFNEIVPRAQRDPSFVAEARKCIFCHAPVIYMNTAELVSSKEQVAHLESGVTCDFCHTFSGYAPNGDYLQSLSMKKQGPFQKTSWHSEYSGFVEVSEFCGPCHNNSNHVGIDVKSTYDEWRESSFALKRIVCQECHMNKNGYLKNGKAEFNSGAAAHINLGTYKFEMDQHERLFSHSFPGAHTDSHLTETIQIEFERGDRTPDSGGKIHFYLIVDNSNIGHSMPTGSSDLRILWLDVTAKTNQGKSARVNLKKAVHQESADYAIAGGSPEDTLIIGNDIPAGARLYRTVYVDGKGLQTLLKADSKKIFDNRLIAGELRREEFEIPLPEKYSGTVNVTATLSYRGTLTSFTRRLGVPDIKPVVITTGSQNMAVTAYPTMENP